MATWHIIDTATNRSVRRFTHEIAARLAASRMNLSAPGRYRAVPIDNPF
jgi:hypothetical protein